VFALFEPLLRLLQWMVRPQSRRRGVHELFGRGCRILLPIVSTDGAKDNSAVIDDWTNTKPVLLRSCTGLASRFIKPAGRHFALHTIYHGERFLVLLLFDRR